MRKWIVFSIALILFSPLVLRGQYFGKNKVQYGTFNWQYIQSEHFDIYFTNGGEKIAEFAAEVAEASYQQLKTNLRYDLVDRIMIITHNSHNDFQQTNIDLNPPEESVGGFTEFFKNRVVVPYEGEWEKFRHVIHHELTHAVMLQMVYGAGVQSIITGMARLQLPLWLIEGLAEYESRGWDTESDMFMRDATLNGYVPPIDYLYGFMAYKGGQSVLYYLDQKYGGEKIGELLGKIKVNKSVERGLKQAIGIDEKELTKKWHMHLKREYWPDIADRKEPEEIARRLTDHTKWHNFVNSGPALSPKGDKLAFLSDRSGYFDIYLMSAIDGRILSKLVSGQQSGDLEELHWLRAGISWSPDGKFIVFAAKSMGDDVLHIVDVKKRKIINVIQLDLDGIFTPSWSPNGDEIAFMGIKHGQGDIYSYQLKTKQLVKLTDDVASDLQPQWSPDGKMLAFVSDRGDFFGDSTATMKDLFERGFRNLDIYLLDMTNRQVQRITNTPHLEASPAFSPKGDRLAYISDENGIFNIFMHDLNSGMHYPITNVISGIFNLSWQGDEKKLAFASFYNAGYDIYLLRNPLDNAPGTIKLKETNFVAKFGHEAFKERYHLAKRATANLLADDAENEYRHFVFDKNFEQGKIESEVPQKSVFLDSSEYKSTTGEYKISHYKIKFSPDIISGAASYSQFFGIQGMTQIALSDVLGNHRINIYTNLFYDLRNSNFELAYFYLPRQTDIGIGAFHYAYYFLIYDYDIGWVRDRNYGANLFVSHPFSKFRRVDAALSYLAVDRDYIEWRGIPTDKRRLLLANLALVNDTVLWGYTGPINGNRYQLGLTYSPGFGDNGVNFLTLRLDYRKYVKVGRENNLVYRLSGGVSEGRQAQNFFLGGNSGWLNYKTRNGLRVRNMDDIYFSTFELPMRGGYYYERVGDRFVLNNLEFRFPLIRYFMMGWPLPIGFQNIGGALFADIGSAWYGNDFRGARVADDGWPALQDIFLGYGIGARLNLGFFVLRFDVAWTSDIANYTRGPYYYFSLGPEF